MTGSPRPVVVAHGGVGGPREHSDACERACAAGVRVLRGGGSALEAAIAATVVLEDDPRLNAGTGSNFRLDGRTIQMDAAVMDHDLRFGAVAAIERVKNPVLVARRVMDSPHVILAGEGATAFARALGFEDVYPVSERAHRRYAEVQAYFAGARDRWPAWRDADPAEWWNFPVRVDASLKAAAGPSDTVGAVARDARGRCAAALSTGGTSIMLLGRVGDTPVPGRASTRDRTGRWPPPVTARKSCVTSWRKRSTTGSPPACRFPRPWPAG